VSLLLVGDDATDDVPGVVAVGIALTTAQTLELRRTGRTEFVEQDGTTVVIGHEDELDSLVEEVSN